MNLPEQEIVFASEIVWFVCFLKIYSYIFFLYYILLLTVCSLY